MSLTFKNPGVYIQELQKLSHAIIPASTSVTAFIGRALRGPVNEPILIHNMGEFNQTFGGIWSNSRMSYAINQYYQNGGGEAVIVRVIHNAGTAFFEIDALPTPLLLQATNPGTWANNLEVTVDFNTMSDPNDDTLFNLAIKYDTLVETFRNLSLKSTSPRFVNSILADQSDFLQVRNNDVKTEIVDPPAFKLDTANKGSDGDDLQINDIKGKQDEKTGMYALENADTFNLLCIPPYDATETTDPSIYTDAAKYCETKRAILLVDPPSDWVKKEDARTKLSTTFDFTYGANAAIFFPRLRAPDPDTGILQEFVPCGAVAGVIAQTDAQRGVWKAPAGIEASLNGVPDLTVRLSDDENGDLNVLGINCLRINKNAGRIVWGSRTMRGNDNLDDQWKYLPVKRTALFIEQTLYQNTQWVVFEPNAEQTWSQIRLDIGAFMHDLYTKGAFGGESAKEAYLVQCDHLNNTPYYRDRGILNILVGFQPVQPAEFVLISIQQMVGQE